MRLELTLWPTAPLLVSTATDVHEIGLRQGMALVVNGLAALVCSPIAGALITAGHDEFTYAIAFGVSWLPCSGPKSKLTASLMRREGLLRSGALP